METIRIKLNSEDLKGDYLNINDCPIYRALKRKNYDVIVVSGDDVTIGTGIYEIKDSLKVLRGIYAKKQITVTLNLVE